MPACSEIPTLMPIGATFWELVPSYIIITNEYLRSDDVQARSGKFNQGGVQNRAPA